MFTSKLYNIVLVLFMVNSATTEYVAFVNKIIKTFIENLPRGSFIPLTVKLITCYVFVIGSLLFVVS